MDHSEFLEVTLEEAFRGQEEGAIPVGCVIVTTDGLVVGQGHNRVLPTGDPTAHAEIETLRAIGDKINDHRDLALYVSSEPCLMCLGAILLLPINQVVWASSTTTGTGSAFETVRESGYDESRFTEIRAVAEPSAQHRLRSRELLRDYCERHGLWERVALLSEDQIES